MNPITRIQKLSRAVGIISKIMCVLLIIGFVVLTIGSLVLYIIPSDFLSVRMDGAALVDVNLDWVPGDWDLTEYEEDILDDNDNADAVLQVGPRSLKVMANADDVLLLTGHRIATLLLVAMVFLAGLFVVLQFVIRLCSSLQKSPTPFTPDILRQLKGLGWALVAWAVVPGLLGSLVMALMHISADQVNISIHLDLDSILLALFFLVLVYVFEYGTQLQRQSDETL